MDEKLRLKKLAAAEAVAQEAAEQPGVECVFLTGSLAAGLGNALSDVDVFVVTSGERPSLPPQHIRDGTRVDIEVRPVGWLANMANHCAAYTATTDSLQSILRPAVNYETAIRIYYSQVVKESAEYAEALGSLRDNETSLRQLAIGQLLVQGLNAFEDCHGALAENDGDMATFSSREVFFCALQAFLVGCGDMYLGHKWIPAKLARTAAVTEQVDSWLRLAGLRENADVVGPVATTVEHRLRVAQALAVAAIVPGWTKPQANEWPYWPSDAPGVRRSAAWFPVRLADAILLGSAGDERRQLKPSEGLLVLWGRIDGDASLDAMVAEAPERLPFVQRLADAGALERLAERHRASA